MAFRAVIDHPKFNRLKALLKSNRATTLGYLECLWHFTGRFAPQGDVGRFSDEEIEAWMEWDGDDGALVAAFVKARWLDADDSHRLVVHDWSQYADGDIHTQLAKKTLRFADGAVPNLDKSKISGDARGRIRAEYAKQGDNVPHELQNTGEKVPPRPESESESESESEKTREGDNDVGGKIWAVFRKARVFTEGCDQAAQLAGLTEVAADFARAGPDRLLTEAKRCRDEFAKDPKLLSQSAPKRFRDWLRREGDGLYETPNGKHGTPARKRPPPISEVLK